MSYKSELRVNSINGVPEHRHGLRNWHWAWSTHEGADPVKDPSHKGIFRADPRSRAEVKAKRGYTATNASIRKAQAEAAAKKAVKPKKARSAVKQESINASVEEAITLASAE